MKVNLQAVGAVARQHQMVWSAGLAWTNRECNRELDHQLVQKCCGMLERSQVEQTASMEAYQQFAHDC
jgi:hypothetical protein